MKFLLNYFFVIVLISAVYVHGQEVPWTWLNKKQFTARERLMHKQVGQAVCSSSDVPLFTQLVFSWNAFRPVYGYFSFHVRVRDAATKCWSGWHKMIDWGNGIQRSYASKADSIAQYHHVRLEVASPSKADAFAIRIESHEGADLSLVHACTVNCTDFTAFVSEVHSVESQPFSSILVHGVPVLSQFEVKHPRNDGLCSPTSCTMLTGYLLKKELDPHVFAESSFDHGLDQYGSWPFNTAHAFAACDGKVGFAVGRLNSFAGIYQRLMKGIPVVVSVRGALAGAPKTYPHGHLLVVVGYDAKVKQVLCHDPAAPTAAQAQQRYALTDFVRAWERSKRLSYLAEPMTRG